MLSENASVNFPHFFVILQSISEMREGLSERFSSYLLTNGDNCFDKIETFFYFGFGRLNLLKAPLDYHIRYI